MLCTCSCACIQKMFISVYTLDKVWWIQYFHYIKMMRAEFVGIRWDWENVIWSHKVHNFIKKATLNAGHTFAYKNPEKWGRERHILVYPENGWHYANNGCAHESLHVNKMGFKCGAWSWFWWQCSSCSQSKNQPKREKRIDGYYRYGSKMIWRKKGATIWRHFAMQSITI